MGLLGRALPHYDLCATTNSTDCESVNNRREPMQAFLFRINLEQGCAGTGGILCGNRDNLHDGKTPSLFSHRKR